MLWDKDDNQDVPAEQEVHPLPWEKCKAMIANDVQPATYSSPEHSSLHMDTHLMYLSARRGKKSPDLPHKSSESPSTPHPSL